MANEMFTTRSGRQVEVPDVFLPKQLVTSAMRLQEDYAVKGYSLTLKYVILLMLTRGERGIRASFKQRENTKAAKAVNAYIKAQLACGSPIDRDHVAKLNGQGKAEPVDLTDESDILDGEIVADELTEEQLDQATAPSGVA
jgi:hypothetical protein